MVSVIRALSWELLRKNRIALIISLGLAPLSWFYLQNYLEYSIGVPIRQLNKFAMIIMGTDVLFLLMLFSYIDTSKFNVSVSGYPKHILLLPIPTKWLAIIPMVLASVVIFSFICLWIKYISYFHPSLPNWLEIAIFTVSIITWSQVLNWGFNQAIVQKIVILISLIALLSISLQSAMINDPILSILGRTGGIIGLLTILTFGFFLAFISIQRMRQGENGLSLNFDALIKRIHRMFPTKLKSFSNGLEAQCWVEWRLFGWLMPLMAVVLGSAVLFVSYVGAPPDMLLLMGFGLFVSLAFMGMEYASMKFGSYQYDLPFYFSTWPLTNFELAQSKLRLSAKSHILSVALTSVLGILSTLFMKNTQLIGAIWEPWVSHQGTLLAWTSLIVLLLAVYTLAWAISNCILAIGLSGSKTARRFYGFIVVALIAGAFLLKNSFDTEPEFLHTWMINHLNFIEWFPLVVIVTFMVYFLPKFLSMASLKQLTPLATKLLGAFTLASVALWQMDMSAQFKFFWSLLMLDLMLLSILPYLIAPVAIAVNRHR